MNHFQLPYIERLQSWSQLREKIKTLDTLQQCIETDAYWQRAPLVNHYLHPQDTSNWPDPWELISENEYCHVARALGICYTLHLIGNTDYSMVEASDEYGDDVIIVRCDKYAMNWHPNTVVNTPLSKFSIKRTIEIAHLLKKIK